MRLTPNEIRDLVKAVGEFIDDNPAELRLFGSRVNHQAKGGDIDLLLLTFSDEVKNQLELQKHYILARMKEFIGDQKIDLKIATKNDITDDAFLQIIYPDSVILGKF